MHIIPHKTQFTQVSLLKTDGKLSDSVPLTTNDNETLSQIQLEAYRLYDAGLNVFPQPHGQKGGYPWKRLQYTRLERDDDDYGLAMLFAGECNMAIMCGHTSGNLFVIDCESPEAFAYHQEQTRRRHLPLWTVETARGGHLYFRCTEGEVENIINGTLPYTEIKGRQGYVLAPPSLHPSGITYHWCQQDGEEPPLVSASQIDWLRDHQGQTVQLKTIAAGKRDNNRQAYISPYSALSRQTRDYIQNGATVPEGNRNNRLFSAACDLAGCSYSQTEAMNLLEPQALGSGLRTKEIRNTIQSAYSQNREPARKNNINATMTSKNQNWRYGLIWATQQNWSGRSGGSQRALFLALIERARIATNENGTFRASIRELAEMAHLGTATVQRVLHDMTENAQLLIKRGNDENSGASLWQFHPQIIKDGKWIELNMDTVCIPPHWLSYSVSVFNSAVTERSALGHAASFVYHYIRLLSDPVMPSAIVRSLGLTTNQINYALSRLRDLGLVRRLRTGWQAVVFSDDQLDERFERGRAFSRRRRERHRRQRRLFAARLLMRTRVLYEGNHLLHTLTSVGRYLRRIRESQKRVVEWLSDPLIALGLELGGVIECPDGKFYPES